MKRLPLALVLLLLLGLGGGAGWWAWQHRAPLRAPAPAEKSSPAIPRFVPEALPKLMRPPIAGLTAAEKADRIERIRRDYDELTAKFSAEYAARNDQSTVGLNGFLRQLALLAREKHADLAAFLTPRELEDVELRDTSTGQTVQRLLGHTTATDEQRREVFRLLKETDDKFALTFDLTPPALLARESDRMATEAKIRAVLGDQLFGAWLAGQSTDYAAAAAFAQQQGLAASVPLDLWRVKSDFIRERLELRARTDLSPQQLRDTEAALANRAMTRVVGLIGPDAVANASSEMLGWLPRPAPTR